MVPAGAKRPAPGAAPSPGPKGKASPSPTAIKAASKSPPTQAATEKLPKPKIPSEPKQQEQKALQSLWTANGAAVSAASGLLAFTGAKVGPPMPAQPVVAVRDFWTPAPGQVLEGAQPMIAGSAVVVAGGQKPPKSCRWKRSSVWEKDAEGEARRAAAQPPPKKCRWKRVVAMAGQPVVGHVVG